MRLIDLKKNLNDSSILSNKGIHGEQLNIILPFLKQCDEFRDVEEIIVMDSPNQICEDKQGQCYMVESKTFKVPDEPFKIKSKKVYLWSIFLLPEIYNLQKIMDKILDSRDNFITPTLYDPKDFTPVKKIVLNIPLISADEEFSDDLKILMIKELLDVMNHQEKFQMKCAKAIMIRGSFEIEKIENDVKC